MKTITSNNALTIFLNGRIDTNNAAETERQIFDAKSEVLWRFY